MVRRPMDVAPGRVSLPDVGLGRGWEPPVLMALTVTLFAFGLVTLYSASTFLARSEEVPGYYWVLRQASGGVAGLVALAVCARLPCRLWQRLAWPLVIGSFLLLVVVVFPGTEGIAPRINGGRRWLIVGGARIQPSEFAKLAVVVWTAMLAVRKQDQFGRLSKGLGPFLVVWGLLLLPVVLQPDFTMAMLIGLLGALTLFAAGARIGHFLFLGALSSPFVAHQLFAVEFRMDRLRAWLDPTADPRGAAWQLYQSLVAIGDGGITGRGFGEGQQKFGFLPDSHNDFIFAMIGEEWGLLGVTFVLLMYAAIVLIGFRVARRAPTLFGQLLAVGCTNLIAIQAVLHISVSLGIVPTTGLALPLISYGRSNLLVTFMAIGILMSIARETDLDWRPDTLARTRRSDLARDLTPGGRTAGTGAARVGIGRPSPAGVRR